VPLASTLSTVFASWPDMVGESVAQHSRPRSLRDGVLVVAVDEPAWATQLRWLEADLLARLEAVLGPGQVARIEVRVLPV
jgi:predicted nucleic acid-binding Zn ribbon protein